ncbi:MAG TPA: crosslink repair DNA glycosylase YcaQ family protein [Kofleriaceae bacterium]|nr:crosslink repair DNA glycosylase YcaQ family protein [Kofleriaceae bacterium]
MKLAHARSVWFAKQALGGSTERSIAKLLGGSGWLRTLGGCDVYIDALARRPGMKRADLDGAVAKGELRVVPAVRGCIYLVPSAIVPDLMALNAETWRQSTTKDLAKIGKKLDVVEKLAPNVLAALATEPLDTAGLRKLVEVASFGDAGKKIGLSSPLPLALRLLELDGRVERTLEGGQLDSERYLWKRASAKPTIAAGDLAKRLANVIEAFIGFAAPFTLAQLAAWSGRSQRDLKPIVADLATAVTIDGMGEAWAAKSDLQPAPAPKGISLLAFEDNYLVNHGLGVVTDPAYHDVEIDIWSSNKKAETLGDAKHVVGRTILVDGMIVGSWEVDPKTKGAVRHVFAKQPKATMTKIEELVHATATFMLDELGTARVASNDTMEDVQRRADRIRKL